MLDTVWHMTVIKEKMVSSKLGEVNNTVNFQDSVTG